MTDGCCSAAEASRKAQNLAHDPRCVLTTEDPRNAVMVEGVAELITRRDELEQFLAAENARYATTYGFEMVDPAVNNCFRFAKPVALERTSAVRARTTSRVRRHAGLLRLAGQPRAP